MKIYDLLCIYRNEVVLSAFEQLLYLNNIQYRNLLFLDPSKKFSGINARKPVSNFSILVEGNSFKYINSQSLLYDFKQVDLIYSQFDYKQSNYHTKIFLIPYIIRSN